MASNERDDRNRWGGRRPLEDDEPRRFSGGDDRGFGWRGGPDRGREMRGREDEPRRPWDRDDYRSRDDRNLMGRDEYRGRDERELRGRDERELGHGWDRGPGDARNFEGREGGMRRDREERGGWGREMQRGGWSPGQEGQMGRGAMGGGSMGGRGSSDLGRGSSGVEGWARGWGGDVGRTSEMGRAPERWSPDDDRGRGRMEGRGDGGRGEMTGRGGMRGRGPMNYTRSDQRIIEDVCDRLTEDDEIDASEIEVKVDKSEVTLTGTLPDREMKRRAEEIAEQVTGVKDVHNQIRVQAQGSTSRESKEPEKAGSNGAIEKDKDKKGDKSTQPR